MRYTRPNMLNIAEQHQNQGLSPELISEQAIPSIDAVNDLVASDMDSVNLLIQKRLHSDVALVNQVSSYIINSGGKRLRPVLVLLSARAFGYTGSQHHNLAAIVEFIHTATLLHDDVVDASDRRRGNDTANALWGNEAAVLVGDFLYSRAFQMMVDAMNQQNQGQQAVQTGAGSAPPPPASVQATPHNTMGVLASQQVPAEAPPQPGVMDRTMSAIGGAFNDLMAQGQAAPPTAPQGAPIDTGQRLPGESEEEYRMRMAMASRRGLGLGYGGR